MTMVDHIAELSHETRCQHMLASLEVDRPQAASYSDKASRSTWAPLKLGSRNLQQASMGSSLLIWTEEPFALSQVVVEGCDCATGGLAAIARDKHFLTVGPAGPARTLSGERWPEEIASV